MNPNARSEKAMALLHISNLIINILVLAFIIHDHYFVSIFQRKKQHICVSLIRNNRLLKKYLYFINSKHFKEEL